MKQILAFLILGFMQQQAFANIECTGLTRDRAYVTVRVGTADATGSPASGEVILEKGGNKYGYRFAGAEVAQFFEDDDAAEKRAVVGVVAYVGKEFPVSAKYVGTNHADMDLKAILADASVPKSASNILRVWRGPGYAATEQLTADRIVCSVWPGI